MSDTFHIFTCLFFMAFDCMQSVLFYQSTAPNIYANNAISSVSITVHLISMMFSRCNVYPRIIPEVSPPELMLSPHRAWRSGARILDLNVARLLGVITYCWRDTISSTIINNE